MNILRSAVLYAALALGANTAAAADIATLEGLRDGSMKKLAFHSSAREVPQDIAFLDADDAEHSLADYRGKVVVLNFWATWCAPCRKEMPGLDRLQAELGGEDFAVLPIATGRNPLPSITKFFDEAGVSALPIRRDPRGQLARQMAVLGLPVTIILNAEGQEIARMTGDAEWDSDSAKAILRSLIESP